MNDLRIDFSIFGDDVNFEEVNSLCDTLPTNCHKKGDKLRYTVAKEDCWSLVFNSTDAEDLESLIGELMQKLNHRTELIQDYCNRYNLHIKLFICLRLINKISPSIYFSKNTIDFFNKVGLDVDFDLIVG